MDIKNIRYALSVIKNRSFTLAAEDLHVSQPALSKYFSNLERILGLQLVDRTSKGLVPTYAGERFYIFASDIEKAIQALDIEMKRIRVMQKNHLRVGMIRNLHQQFIANTIESFNRHHPNIELNITQALSRDIENGVARGMLDIGFISEPSIHGDLDYRALTENYTLLAAPAAMNLTAHAVNVAGLPFLWLDINILKDVRMVMQDESCRFRKILDEFFSSEHFVPNTGMTAQSTLDALHFAELGIGPCIITDGYIGYITKPERVDVFCVGTPPATTKFGVIAKNFSLLPPYANDFIEIYMCAHTYVGHDRQYKKAFSNKASSKN